MQSVDYVILGMLSVYPSTGYDMKSELEYGGAGYFSALTFGSIYPRLKALEDDGYIVTVEAEAGGRRRRAYDLTAKGWLALADWLGEPAAFPIPMRDELLLKMVFWTGARPDDRETLIAHLRRRREQSTALLDRLGHLRENFGYVSEIGMLTLNYMTSRLRAELEWIDASIAQLEGSPTGPAQDPRGLAVQQRERRDRALGAPTAMAAGDADQREDASHGRAARRARHRKDSAT